MKFIHKINLMAITAIASINANAEGGTDFSAITGAVDLSTATAAILGIGGTLAGLYVARKGLFMVLGMLRSKG